MRIPILMLVACALTAGAAASINAASSPAEPPITEIRLERTPCFGGCPVDAVTLRADGTATYVGTRFVPKVGAFRGAFPRETFTRLATLLRTQKFFGLSERYDVRATDLPSTVTSAVRSGKRKTVTNRGDAGPVQLWALERVILQVSSEIRWEPEAGPKAGSGIGGLSHAARFASADQPR